MCPDIPRLYVFKFQDAAINESWDWVSVQRRLRQRDASRIAVVAAGKHRQTTTNVRLNVGSHDLGQQLGKSNQQQRESWLNAVWRWCNERAINARLVGIMFLLM